PEGLSRIRLDIKPQPGEAGCRVKLKIEAGGESPDAGEAREADDAEAAPDASGRPRYKSLKKHMKTGFKAIQTALTQGGLPAPAVVEAFLADSETMCTYPDADKGASHYGEYLEALAGFRAAWQVRDPAALRAGVEALAECKRRCHDLYK
ncbi:MAG: GAK system XXXCH domain-containing protein, partial [Desulfovibrionaceae bacterium]